MQRDVRKYLFDILKACDYLHQFSNGKSLDDYLKDPFLRSAVERQFEVIGEALNIAIRIKPELRNLIQHTQRIISFRNRLIHGYSSTAHDVVWEILQSYVPTLEQEINAILQSYENNP